MQDETTSVLGYESLGYTGYREVAMSPEEVQPLLDGGSAFPSEVYPSLLKNEYLVVYTREGERIGIWRRKNDVIVPVRFQTIDSHYMGSIKPRNLQQELAVDMLNDRDMTVKILTGKFGTGKDFLMLSAAVAQKERGLFDKIIYIRNNVEVKHTKPLGALPGGVNDKLMPYAMPLAEKLGGVDAMNRMIDEEELELAPLGTIRGRDIKNAIILCSEAENMTVQHIQLMIGRVGEGSALWINGDFKQVDAEVFRTNSGLMRAVERLKGQRLFGYVMLQKTERSETAALADLLD